MNYLWQKFNIKTFAAETIVFSDGVFMPELSTLQSTVLDKKYDLPIHIIYIGEIKDYNKLDINLSVDNQPVFLTIKTQNKKPAFLNIFIKNTGKNSVINAKITANNYSDLKIDVFTGHFAKNTGNFITTKVIAHDKSNTKLSGLAQIDKNCIDCENDISFSVLAAQNAKIEFQPAQRIGAIPKSAGHSASLYHPTKPVIEYLRTGGLSGAEIKDILEEAFINYQ